MSGKEKRPGLDLYKPDTSQMPVRKFVPRKHTESVRNRQALSLSRTNRKPSLPTFKSADKPLDEQTDSFARARKAKAERNEKENNKSTKRAMQSASNTVRKKSGKGEPSMPKFSWDKVDEGFLSFLRKSLINEARFEEIIHHNPSIEQIKALSKRFPLRYAIHKNGDIKVGNANKFVHPDLSDDFDHVEIEGMIRHDKEKGHTFYADNMHGEYEAVPSHPHLDRFEKAGMTYTNRKSNKLPGKKAVDKAKRDWGDELKEGIKSFKTFLKEEDDNWTTQHGPLHVHHKHYAIVKGHRVEITLSQHHAEPNRALASFRVNNKIDADRAGVENPAHGVAIARHIERKIRSKANSLGLDRIDANPDDTSDKKAMGKFKTYKKWAERGGAREVRGNTEDMTILKENE